MPTPAPVRLASADIWRGLVMFLMMAEVFHLGQMAKVFPDSDVWKFLGYHQSHAEWRGCTLHDLIQPSFSFLVGVALPFSLASRAALGQSVLRLAAHALWRSLILIGLGIFLRSTHAGRTNFTFEDTLTQIGLGYPLLWLLGRSTRAVQVVGFAAILVSYFAFFAAWPLPPDDFDWKAVGVSDSWRHPEGFAAHWDKNSNPAWAFDVRLLNEFPREKPFTHNGGGYATLSFIPTLATMILGLLAGGFLRTETTDVRRFAALVLSGIVLLGVGHLLDATGVCPSVKRIWTPAWVLVSGGWCLLIFALLFGIVDGLGWQRWGFFFRVIGTNSIVAYVGSHLIEDFLISTFRIHLGNGVFGTFGPEYAPVVRGAMVMSVYWLILSWMYRRRIFVRV